MFDNSRWHSNPIAGSLSYGDVAYWSARYRSRDHEAYDWYVSWAHLKELLSTYLCLDSQILILGCGTSRMSDEMHAEGFVNITNVDRCESVITTVAERTQDKPTVEFHALDAQHLLEKWTGKFEVVIEKAMLDAIACGQDHRTEIQAMLHEVSRVLRPSCGVYVCVSHAPPDERFPFLVGRQGGETNVSEEYGWRVVHQIVDKPGCPLDAKGKSQGVDLPRSAAFKLEEHVYHLYVCSKS